MDRVEVAGPAVERTARPSSGRRRTRMALALAAALALGGAGYLGRAAWNDGTQAARITTTAAVRGDVEDAVTATGVLQPRDYVDVGTQVSGQLRRLHVQVGSTVSRGQLLAEIDPTVYLTRVDANRAQLRTQLAQLVDRQAQLALAVQQARRQENLRRENATTQEAVDQAAAALGSARAQIDVLEAQAEQTRSALRGDEANLGYTKIHAPMAGTVVSQNAKEGQTLNANQQAPVVVRIADLSTMTVQAQVSEADVSRLAVGMDVYFTTLGNPSRRWYARLRQIEPTPVTLNNVVLYNALFDVGNAGGTLMTQMTAQVFFVTAQARDAVIVPVTALRRAGAGEGGDAARGGRGSGGAGWPEAGDPRRFANGPASVRVVGEGGAVEERRVQVGVVSRVSAQVVSGLEAGEQVVTGTAQPAAAVAARPGGNGVPRMQPRP